MTIIKKTNLKAAKATAWKWFSLYIRLRDSDSTGYVKCCTCNTWKFYRDISAGHYLPKGAYKRIEFDPRNVHPQETSCNMFKGGNLSVYSQYMIKRYGNDIHQILVTANHTNQPIKESGYRELATTYRKLVKELLENKGLTL